MKINNLSIVNWNSASLYKQLWVNLGSRLSIPKKGVTFKKLVD